MQASKLLFVAEAALSYNYVRMSQDPLYAVKEQTGFTWQAGTQEYSSASLTLDSSATKSPTARIGWCWTPSTT